MACRHTLGMGETREILATVNLLDGQEIVERLNSAIHREGEAFAFCRYHVNTLGRWGNGIPPSFPSKVINFSHTTMTRLLTAGVMDELVVLPTNTRSSFTSRKHPRATEFSKSCRHNKVRSMGTLSTSSRRRRWALCARFSFRCIVDQMCCISP